MSDGILDTTFFIDFRRGDPSASSIWDEIGSGLRTGAFSPVTTFELWAGPRFSREEELLFESMFALLDEVAITGAAAKTAAAWLRGRPDRQEIIFRDAQIAASAAERKESVLTRNVSDFAQFPSLTVEAY